MNTPVEFHPYVTQLLKPQGLKLQLFREIVQHPNITRKELMHKLGVSASAITKSLVPLLDKGIVTENTHSAVHNTGRPSSKLKVNENFGLFAALIKTNKGIVLSVRKINAQSCFTKLLRNDTRTLDSFHDDTLAQLVIAELTHISDVLKIPIVSLGVVESNFNAALFSDQLNHGMEKYLHAHKTLDTLRSRQSPGDRLHGKKITVTSLSPTASYARYLQLALPVLRKKIYHFIREPRLTIITGSHEITENWDALKDVIRNLQIFHKKIGGRNTADQANDSRGQHASQLSELYLETGLDTLSDISHASGVTRIEESRTSMERMEIGCVSSYFTYHFLQSK